MLSLYELTLFFFFSSRRRHTRCSRDWSSDVCSSDLDRARSRCRCPDRAGPGGSSGPAGAARGRSEERRVGKSVDLGGRRIIKKKKRRIERGRVHEARKEQQV